MSKQGVQYVCNRCHYSTNRKSNYDNHINRKRQCALIHQQFNLECPYCNQLFSHQSSKSRHIKACMVIIPSTKPVVHSGNESKQKNSKRHGFNQGQNQGQSIPIAYTVINNGIINNITNTTININGLGREDISFITNQTTERLTAYMDTLFSHRMPMRRVCEFMVEKHFDQTRPQNQNIRKLNRKDNFIDCHDGNAWKTCFYTEALEQIMDNVRKNFEEFVNRIFDNNGKIKTENLDKFMKEVGEPLGLDITGDDYDWNYDMTDDEKAAKRARLYSMACEYIYQNTRNIAHQQWINMPKPEGSANTA